MLDQDPAQAVEAAIPSAMLRDSNCPLIDSDRGFAGMAAALRLSTNTATILDDIRFLTTRVNSKVEAEDERIRNTASWIYRRLEAVSETPAENDMDHIRGAVRNAAIIYTWAVFSRKPMSNFDDATIRHELFVATQSIDNKIWETMPGIYLWIMLVTCSGAPADFHGRFLRRKVSVAAAAIAFDNFPLAIMCLRSFWLVQRWIAEGKDEHMATEE
jgi:hypothetical protein